MCIRDRYELQLNLEKQRESLERTVKTKNNQIAKILCSENECKELLEKKKSLENCAALISSNIERLETLYEDIEMEKPLDDILRELSAIAAECENLKTTAMQNGVEVFGMATEGAGKINFAEEFAAYIRRSLRNSFGKMQGGLLTRSIEKPRKSVNVEGVVAKPFSECFARGKDGVLGLSLIHICRCRRIERCRSRWSPYH
eukprot:TRINITY_DN12429_c0_g1_i9.p1 TRINITY_DN12429_c0_g1~~TRINITY_DN12429_c0_g1_i9.p1  ORF type:complete len:201 (+),score=48.33 TRINITY_DN12429_c0_g1_i9:73-675(+)